MSARTPEKLPAVGGAFKRQKNGTLKQLEQTDQDGARLPAAETRSQTTNPDEGEPS